MRLAFIADARSPIAQNWISYFVTQGHDVHIISSYPCSADEWPGARLYAMPIGLNRLSQLKPSLLNDPSSTARHDQRLMRQWLAWLAKVSREVQGHVAGPLDAVRRGSLVRHVLEEIRPDLVHAMRIPYEGIMAAHAVTPQMRLLVSVWGNDFTLHASHYRLVRRETLHVLQHAMAVHTDCWRDLRLAVDWGFDSRRPSVVLPGAGGIQTALFYPGEPSAHWQQQLALAPGAPVVINPRGLRKYVRNDVFFQAIPAVLRERPDTIFLCSAMQGNLMVEKWIEQLGIANNVRLLPSVSRQEMAEIFRLAQVTVSPSAHDGTPNTLLEAMATGCFPVAADIESVREWIDNGVNGLLYDVHDAAALARALVQALGNSALRQTASGINSQLIAERAEYGRVMACAENFYRQLIDQPVSLHA